MGSANDQGCRRTPSDTRRIVGQCPAGPQIRAPATDEQPTSIFRNPHISRECLFGYVQTSKQIFALIPWRNGQRIRLRIWGLRVRVPSELLLDSVVRPRRTPTWTDWKSEGRGFDSRIGLARGLDSDSVAEWLRR